MAELKSYVPGTDAEKKQSFRSVILSLHFQNSFFVLHSHHLHCFIFRDMCTKKIMEQEHAGKVGTIVMLV